MTAQGCLKPLAYTLGGLVVLALGFYFMIVVSFGNSERAQYGDNFRGPIETATCRDYREVFSVREREYAPGELAWWAVTRAPEPTYDVTVHPTIAPELRLQLDAAEKAIKKALVEQCPASERRLLEIARETYAASPVFTSGVTPSTPPRP